MKVPDWMAHVENVRSVEPIAGGSLGVVVGDTNTMAFLLPDPAQAPSEVRRAVVARNLATLTGTCPLCGDLQSRTVELRSQRVRQEYHDSACPTTDDNILRATERSS